MKNNDYLKLFAYRESIVVLGKKYSTLWILTAMLVLTFIAIAFSNASLRYLKNKMDDPFTNWVNIPVDNEEDIYRLREYFEEGSSLREKYNIEHFGVDFSYHYLFFGKTPDRLPYLGCLFLESFKDSESGVVNPLLKAILSKDNVLDGYAVSLEQIEQVIDNDENLIGVIITEKRLKSMGYDETNYPTFLNFRQLSEGADDFGFELYDDYAMVPIPILAIVDKLPMNMDIVASAYFFEQQQSQNLPFSLDNEEYASSLFYYVEEEKVANEIYDYLYEQASSDCDIDDYVYMPYNLSYRDGKILHVESIDGDLNYDYFVELDERVIERFGNDALIRIYDYDFSYMTPTNGTFVSVQFNSDGLKTISEFATYMNEEFHVDIEMSQVVSKQNFSAVSVTAQILIWTIILFAILSILLFIINLLNTYFQRVKRNMGTFKAFGVSNRELIRIYVVILLAIVFVAICLAMMIVGIIQCVFNVYHLAHDTGDAYLLIGNYHTLGAMIIILLSTVVTTYLVMKHQLSATPGDLIYDR